MICPIKMLPFQGRHSLYKITLLGVDGTHGFPCIIGDELNSSTLFPWGLHITFIRIPVIKDGIHPISKDSRHQR